MEFDHIFGTFNNSTTDIMELDSVFKLFKNSIMNIIESNHVSVTSNYTIDVIKLDYAFVTSNENTIDIIKLDHAFVISNKSTIGIIESDHVFKTFNNSIRDTTESEGSFKPFDKVFVDNSIVELECTFTTFNEACATIERYAVQTNTVPECELVKSGIYEIVESNADTYNVMQIDDNTTHIVYIKALIYLLFLHISVPLSEIHQHWNMKHYLMQQAFSHITKYGKVPVLQSSNSNVSYKSTFNTISIDNLTSYNKINMPTVKCEHS
ncbi:22647_t:CDS:2 [Cetraspora pellucida]|uniref:22647_t:CDS:1 n=1 Tax=Cetraspora pellucida TaxID=1433469 RepID=A0A9N9AUH1_9GLOM|nr:22647_t:CDS:2 [Cetraspora pellucida]